MGLAKVMEGLRKGVWKEMVHIIRKLRREERHEKGNERLNGKR